MRCCDLDPAIGAEMGGGFVTIVNSGSQADKLVGASFALAERAEVHEMKMEGDVMKMAPVEGGLDIPAGGTVALAPMGYHLMFTQIGVPFKQGECVELVLHFAGTGDLPIQLNIGSVAQDEPVMDHSMHEMSSAQ